MEPATDAAPVLVALLRLRRRRAERLVPLPVAAAVVPAPLDPAGLAPAPFDTAGSEPSAALSLRSRPPPPPEDRWPF